MMILCLICCLLSGQLFSSASSSSLSSLTYTGKPRQIPTLTPEQRALLYVPPTRELVLKEFGTIESKSGTKIEFIGNRVTDRNELMKKDPLRMFFKGQRITFPFPEPKEQYKEQDFLSIYMEINLSRYSEEFITLRLLYTYGEPGQPNLYQYETYRFVFWQDRYWPIKQPGFDSKLFLRDFAFSVLGNTLLMATPITWEQPHIYLVKPDGTYKDESASITRFKGVKLLDNGDIQFTYGKEPGEEQEEKEGGETKERKAAAATGTTTTS